MSRGKTTQSEAIEEEQEKPPFKIDGVQWLSETIEMNMLFRIKGKQGIFTPLINPNKAGMIRMERFMSTEAYTVHRLTLKALSGLVIYGDNGDTIALPEAFDNLREFFDNEIISGGWDNPEMLLIICPNYDKDRFKNHHAKKIINWYNEIITAINNATE